VLAAALTALAPGCSREKPPEAPKQAGPTTPAPPVAAAPADERPVIVAFGDSLTAGLGVDAASNYPAFLQRELDARGLRYRVVNAGVSGDTTGGGVARLGEVLAYEPKVVILELGANDGLRGLPLETTRANLDQMIAALQAAGAQVVLAGMTLPPNYGADYIRGFEQIFVDLAAKHKIPRIPFLLDNVAARPHLMQSDALHPNAAGQKIVAANVLKTLEPLLR
jgi:acyl-CoA thioesterase-1